MDYERLFGSRWFGACGLRARQPVAAANSHCAGALDPFGEQAIVGCSRESGCRWLSLSSMLWGRRGWSVNNKSWRRRVGGLDSRHAFAPRAQRSWSPRTTNACSTRKEWVAMLAQIFETFARRPITRALERRRPSAWLASLDHTLCSAAQLFRWRALGMRRVVLL